MNWHRCLDILIEELSSEGLEGCSFDDLYRIVKSQLITDENSTFNEDLFRCYLWRIIVNCPSIEFHELTTNKSSEKSKNDVAIENVELNTRGYCPSYFERRLIVDKSTLADLNKISNLSNIHLVVEQNVREFRITQGQFDTKQLFSKNEYALLECICKTRSKGIPTSGNDGLAKIFDLNSKSLFYYLKQLIALEIVKKLNLTRQLAGTLKQPILILSRYVTKNDYLNSKYTIIDRLKNYLEQTPNKSCERNYLKTFLSLGEKSFRSLMRKCKRMNLIEKYNKTMNEYELKRIFSNEPESSTSIALNNRIRLRSYTFFRLKSNEVNKDEDEELASSTDDNEQTDDEEIEEESENEDEDDDPDAAPLSEASSQLDLSKLRLFVDRPFHFQYYQLLEQVKHVGLSQRDLAQVCHLSFYSARSEIKSLTKNVKHIALKSVQLNPKGKIMENRIVLRKYMPSDSLKIVTNPSSNVQEQIIGKTARSKSKKSPSVTSAKKETVWQKTEKPVNEEKSAKKSKNRVNPVKRINIKREHRLDLIREHISKQKICTLTDLRSALMSHEREEGLTIHMDRKTLDKLVDQLEKEEKFLFRFTARIKQSRSVVCLAQRTEEIQPDCPEIRQFQIDLSQQTIEVSTNEEKIVVDDESKSTIDQIFSSELEDEKIRSLKKKPLENLSAFGNCYGYVYKFQRCAILHKFLFYLLYGYEGESDVEQSSNNEFETPLVSDDPQIQAIFDSIPETRRFSKSTKNFNWKSFIPAVDHRGRSIPAGCLHLDDVFMSMPVSIFLAIVYVPYKVPGLVELLSHPVKRHILVKDLPAEMRYPLVVRRHYLYRIMEILKYLSTLGLISFVERAAVNRIEKLNTLIYLHTSTYLINTINQTNNSNGPIDNINNYPKQNYNFQTMSQLHRYWFDLIEISLNTYRVKIFSRKQERSHINEVLKQSLKPISYESIQTIKTPLGKSNGPAGFDYDLYLFLRKSWKLPYSNKRVLKLLNRESNQCCIPVCELRVPIDVALKRSYTRHLTQKRQQQNRRKNYLSFNSSTSNENNFNLSNVSQSLSTMRFRRINFPLLPCKSNDKIDHFGHLSRYIVPFDVLNQIQFIDRRKKVLFQTIRERNKTILQRYNDILHQTSNEPRKSSKNNDERDSDDEEQFNSTALRVRWSPIEERVISLINATLRFYLPRRQNENNETTSSAGRRPAAFLPFNKELFRACLVRVLPRSARSKTPQNVVRKIKNDMTQSTRLTQLEHLSLLCSTDTYLLAFRNEAKRHLKYRFRSNEHFFLLLFERIYGKFQNFVRTGYLSCVPHGTIDSLPASREILLENYRIVGKPQVDQAPIRYTETTKSILSSTISMAIHSSLLSNERSGTAKAFILHYMFSQYPESLLNEIVYRLMHTDAVITLTKSNDIQRKISNEASTFLAGRAYHINQRYIYRWYTYIPSTIFNETATWLEENLFSRARRDHDLDIKIEVEEQNQVSIVASLVTFFDSNNFDVRLALPKTLDNEPEMLMHRYQSNNSQDDDDDEDDTNSDENDDDQQDQHERVFEQVLQTARRIDQTRYEKRKLSTDEGSPSKKVKFQNSTKEIEKKGNTQNRHNCNECSKSFSNRTSLVRHRSRQHEKNRQVKSRKNSFRPGSISTSNPYGRGRHATDTSSLSCCSIDFCLSKEFLTEQISENSTQKKLKTISNLILSCPFYSSIYVEESYDEKQNDSILSALLEAQEIGLTFDELFNKIGKSLTFSEIVEKLVKLVDRGAAIAAGNVRRVFVHRRFARPWLICSIRFRNKETTSDVETILTSALLESNSISIDEQNKRDENFLSNHFEKIFFVPRPWKSIDGSINFFVLQRMMESLLLFIVDRPGLNLMSLHEHFHSVLLPVAIDEIVELFQQIQCLEIVQLFEKTEEEQRVDLFSTETHNLDEQIFNVDPNISDRFETIFFKNQFDHRRTSFYLFPTFDCLNKFSLSFPSELVDKNKFNERMPFPMFN